MSSASARGVRAVIDGDGHLMEDANLWIDYIEPGYRDVAPRLVADGDGARLMMDGRLFPISSGPDRAAVFLDDAHVKGVVAGGLQWDAACQL